MIICPHCSREFKLSEAKRTPKKIHMSKAQWDAQVQLNMVAKDKLYGDLYAAGKNFRQVAEAMGADQTYTGYRIKRHYRRMRMRLRGE